MNVIFRYRNCTRIDTSAYGVMTSEPWARWLKKERHVGGVEVRRPLRRRAAFSLVEVVLAIGIISFSLVAVVGLIPVGLTTMREAMDDNTCAQIINQITGEVLLTPFSKLDANFSNQNFYYDEQGTRKDLQSDQTRYEAVTSLVGARYPGSGNVPTGTPIANSLATVRVSLTTAPSANAIVKSTKLYNIMVPNSGN